MNRIKINKINCPVILSLLIHLSLLFITFKEGNETLGDKIIPIEVYDDLLASGTGESVIRKQQLTNKTLLKEQSQKGKKSQEFSEQFKSFADNNIYKNNKETKAVKKRNNINNQTFLKEEMRSGSKNGIINNEPEKGSLKGNGTIKITCLKCVRPIYPPVALRRGSEGKSIIKIWINTNGTVTKSELINKSGIESIDSAALKAANLSTFYPIEKGTTINIEYEMKLK
tara:strand:+ start:196 stop:876 length:681 start_codon:yes stop_codon:yes gene_type:complete